MLQNIKARLFAKPFCVWKEKVVKKGNGLRLGGRFNAAKPLL